MSVFMKDNKNTIVKIDALDLAEYVLKTATEKKIYLNNLQLQQVLIRINKEVHKNLNFTLFDNQVVEMPIGDVVLDVFRKYKTYSSKPILDSTILKDLNHKNWSLKEYKKEFKEKHKLSEEIIDIIDREIEKEKDRKEDDVNKENKSLLPAYDLARYIVEKSTDAYKPVNNIQLQRILANIKERLKREKGVIAFNEKVEEASFGPIIPKIYNSFAFYSFNPIIILKNEYKRKLKEEYKINDEIIEIINEEIEKEWKEKNPWDLMGSGKN